MPELFNYNWLSEENVSGQTAPATGQMKSPASVEMQMRYLEENLAKALLINEALWELIREKLHLTEQQLFDKLYEIDMRDGTIDGKNQRSVVECPKCRRKVAPKHAACLYCGQIIDNSVFQMSR